MFDTDINSDLKLSIPPFRVCLDASFGKEFDLPNRTLSSGDKGGESKIYIPIPSCLCSAEDPSAALVKESGSPEMIKARSWRRLSANVRIICNKLLLEP